MNVDFGVCTGVYRCVRSIETREDRSCSWAIDPCAPAVRYEVVINSNDYYYLINVECLMALKLWFCCCCWIFGTLAARHGPHYGQAWAAIGIPWPVVGRIMDFMGWPAGLNAGQFAPTLL